VTIAAILQRLDAEWQSLGCDEVAASVVEPVPEHPIPDALKVQLTVHVRTGLEHSARTWDNERAADIHRALLSGQPPNPILVERARQCRLGSELLAKGLPTPHSPSVAQGVGRHDLELYFADTTSPDDVIAKLRAACALFEDMLAQRPKHEGHAALMPAKEHQNRSWTLAFRRPA